VPPLLLPFAPVVAAVAVAVLVAALLARAAGPPAPGDRLVSLDGLRGYLALGVFLHHAMWWRGYVRTGVWNLPDGAHPVYAHLGQGAVTLFFMLTGFLFGAKLADGRRRPVDWTRLYVGRVLRIYPLYAVALAATLVAVAARSGFARRAPAAALARGVLAWARFGHPDLNGVAGAWMPGAGVQWSLAYEWMFYSALPLAALLYGVVAPARWLAASAVAVAVWARWIAADSFFAGVNPLHLAAFAAGALAMHATRRPAVRRALGGRAGAALALAALAAVAVFCPVGYRAGTLALLAVPFTVVAAGNTLFGVLRWPASRLLGETSYGIYLLHGFVLYALVHGVLGERAAAALAGPAYWALVVALVPAVVLVAFAASRLVERPAVRATPRAARWVAARLGGRAAAAPPAVRAAPAATLSAAAGVGSDGRRAR
jgi:peptidoglycan/LPS O-acetylase OafA/YrhL